MVQVTIFGGHDGQLRGDKWFYLTLFGSCDLLRPTIARQLLANRGNEGQAVAPERKPYFLTLFGGVDIKSPTLCAEFIDLKEMLGAGLLTMTDWERAVTGLGQEGSGVASFTIFGGFNETALPSENEEIESLASQRHLGNVSESAGQILQFGIGQGGSERRATIHRAIQTTV